MNDMSGDIVVAGLVTGTHVIEDIRVMVPHQAAVRIPADLALRSKDLWRGIQQGKLFKLDGGAGFHATKVPSNDPTRIVQLETENKRLRSELEAERVRNESLSITLSGFQAQFEKLQTTLGRLESLPRITLSAAGSPIASTSFEGAVGGDIPTYVPGQIRPDSVESQIRSSTETTEKANVSSAASKLREMKKAGG